MFGIAPLLANKASTEVATRIKAAKRKLALFSLIGLLVLTGYLTAVAALTVHVSATYGLVSALMIVSVSAVVLAMLCWLVFEAYSKYKLQKEQESAAATTLAISTGFAMMPVLVKNRGLIAALTVAGIIAVAGSSKK